MKSLFFSLILYFLKERKLTEMKNTIKTAS